MNMTHSSFVTSYFIIVLTLLGGMINISCIGNPPNAPFGSTIEIQTSSIDFSIPLDSIVNQRVEALVTNSEGEPLNGVIVIWELVFAGLNDLLLDTNGDDVPDSRILQLVDPDACPSPGGCQNTALEKWFGLGAFVNSPFITTTNDRGVADVIILIHVVGDIDATLSASLDSGSVDDLDLTIECNNCAL
ncbi:hypothetical protein MYX76_13010 [Desulfobacterota bacterium AH_259_B03_O07]|nr:hypothetical protein [Desulfobacterota bacterium AH_259_B03_O07]